MLRYKNSLLERILLEKGKRTFLSLFFDTNKEIGIDVQAELRLKGSPHLRPMRPGGMTGQASPMQRAMLNRQQSVRQRPVMAPPPIQTVNQAPRSSIMGDSLNSPNVQPTPPSQHSSPSTTRSPGFPLQGMTSPTADVQQRQPLQQFSQHRQVQPMPHNAFQQQARQHNRSMSANTVGQSYRNSRMQAPAPQVQANYYPTSFQKHYDQLGKSTPTFPLPQPSGSFVRPRLNPLVQTRSTTHKLICLTTSTATMWMLTASFQTSGCLHRLGCTRGWGCRPLHRPRQAPRATPETTYPRYHSIMTRCLMLIRSASAHLCTFPIRFRIHFEGKLIVGQYTGIELYIVVPQAGAQASKRVHVEFSDGAKVDSRCYKSIYGGCFGTAVSFPNGCASFIDIGCIEHLYPSRYHRTAYNHISDHIVDLSMPERGCRGKCLQKISATITANQRA